MEIILDVAATRGGRLSGTVTRAGQGAALSFSGTLELFACLEQLLHEHDESRPRDTEPGSVT